MNVEIPSPADSSAPPVVVRRKSALKKVIWVAIAVCAGFLLLVAALVLFKDSILRVIAERNVQHSTGMETRIGDLRLGLTSTSLMLKDFKVINPKQFGGAPFFSIPEIYMELDADKAGQGLLYFKELRFNLAEVNVVKGKDGKLNLDYMQEALEKAEMLGRTNSFGGDYKFGGIDKMLLTLRSINYTDLQQPDNSYKTDLAIQNEEVKGIKSEEDLNKWAVSMMTKIALQQMFSPQPKAKSGLGLDSLLDLLKKK